MRFKKDEYALEFGVLPKVLKAIALDMDRYAQEHFGIELTVTRVFEHVPGETGVHQRGLAIDFRDEYMGELTFNLDQRRELLEYVNNRYVRSDGLKTLLSHKFKGGPRHWHVQCQSEWAKHDKIF